MIKEEEVLLVYFNSVHMGFKLIRFIIKCKTFYKKLEKNCSDAVSVMWLVVIILIVAAL